MADSLLFNINQFFSGSLNRIVIGIITSLLVLAITAIIKTLGKPKLKILFDENDTFDTAQIQNIPNKPIGLYIHLRIINKRSKIAKNCKVFLKKLEKKEKSKFTTINIKTPLMLKWANISVKDEFAGIEILDNERKRVDFFHAVKGDNKFFFFIEPGPRGLPVEFTNGFSNGIYKVTINAYGDNTNIVEKKFIVEWNGKFEGIRRNIPRIPVAIHCIILLRKLKRKGARSVDLI